jgi:hypothetical protein
MNALEKLLHAADADVRDLDFHGVPLRIRKLGAIDGAAVHGMLPKEGDTYDHSQLIRLYTYAVSKSLIGDDGTPDTDSEDGRTSLAKLPLPYLQDLYGECLRFSGLASEDAKKNESGQNLNDSPTDSASPSESSIPNA